MTLVIAGYSNGRMETGVYFAADGNITTNNNILVSGFKKVVELPIRVKSPEFIDDSFWRYYGDRFTANCAIAFAGSTLVAQHILNAIRNHLTTLRPTYEKGNYLIAMMCENKDIPVGGYYDETMFTDNDLNSLVTAEYLAGVVYHSISNVLINARKHGSMKNLFGAYQAEFIFAVRCPLTKRFQIHQYNIVPDESSDAKVISHLVPLGSLAVIGMKDKFLEGALNALQELNADESASYKIFNYLNNCIEDETSIGNFGIGKPSALYNFSGNELVKL